MAAFSSASLKLDTSKPYLKEKGYWFYMSNKEIVSKSVPIPIRPGAVWISRFMIAWIILVFVIFAANFFSASFQIFAKQHVWLLAVCYLGPAILIRLGLIGKIYDPRYKDYKAVNKGQHDNLYTSDQSLYSTEQDGIYLCEICSTPVATTDDKEKIIGHTVHVHRLIEDGNGLDIQDGMISCSVCGTELGALTSGSIELDGEKLVLDSGELHYIYPENKA